MLAEKVNGKAYKFERDRCGLFWERNKYRPTPSLVATSAFATTTGSTA